MNKTSSWDKSSHWYNKIVGAEGHYYHRQVVLPAVIKMLELEKESKILEIGCGQGVLARVIPTDTEYWGMDISPQLIKQAINIDTNSKHHYLVGDATKNESLPRLTFTHAAIVLAIQNIKEVQAVFNNISQRLTPGGKLVIILNHPCFRIPRQSGWDKDEVNKLQKRWIVKYMSPMDIPILMHPGEKSGERTWTYHYPLGFYIKALRSANFVVDTIDELISGKESVGKAAKMENRSREEIPLFMALRALKQV